MEETRGEIFDEVHPGEADGFEDVELMVADYVEDQDLDRSDDVFGEAEVAEVLAATWKEKRAEINKLQKARRFDAARDLKRTFRAEVEEMKRKTTCNRCGRVGHWARECRQARDPSASKGQGKGASSGNGGSGSKESGVSYVETDKEPAFTFIAAASLCQTLLERVRRHVSRSDPVVAEILLVSSPGYGVLDSGCGKTIIGQNTFAKFREIWKQKQVPDPVVKEERNTFRFGNGMQETSELVALLPICLGGRLGQLAAAVVKGDAPLLISRPALKKLDAQLDFAKDQLILFSGAQTIDLDTNAAGQYVVNVCEFSKPKVSQAEAETLVTEAIDEKQAGEPGTEVKSDPSPFVGACVPEETACCAAESSVPVGRRSGLSQKQLRRLRRQVTQGLQPLGTNYAVIEVFCPPRLTPQVEQMGLRGLAVDLETGWNLMRQDDVNWLENEIRQHPPELLVLCPPCTDAGGWYSYNSMFMSPAEVLQRSRKLRRWISIVKRLITLQVQAGGRFILEHPVGSRLWRDDGIRHLMSTLTSFVTHMCCFDLHVPATESQPRQRIKKSTRLLVSHEDMKHFLWRLCPGASHAEHVSHAVIEGSRPGVGSVSRHAGRYTARFIQAMLRATPNLQPMEVLLVDDESPRLHPENAECFEILASAKIPPEKTHATLMKLHKNLGHPNNGDLVRILKHGQASEEAISVARSLDCEFCQSRKAPTAAHPAQAQRVTEFNARVGLDVKWLPGWKGNQKIRALNIVDHASSFQLVLPFFETETSSVIRSLYSSRWVTWAGPPRELVMDPARTNVGREMVEPTELEGTQILMTAAGAHWQLGKTEVHGGWFSRVLERILDEVHPTSKEQWLECVQHAHVKNQMIQVYGYTPSQMIFGKNPNLPGDLMSEPLSIVAGTASDAEEAIARAYAVRTAARKAVLELQDSAALRRALLARSRVDRDFRAGDVVAYWRDQKWNQGKLSKGGRWYGSGVVLGLVGRNVIIAHRNHILRCAPEQVRFATPSERSLIETPETQLLGIKDMIEGGTFRSAQCLDLLSQSYPPREADVSAIPDSEAAPAAKSVASPQGSGQGPTDVQARAELPEPPLVTRALVIWADLSNRRATGPSGVGWTVSRTQWPCIGQVPCCKMTLQRSCRRSCRS